MVGCQVTIESRRGMDARFILIAQLIGLIRWATMRPASRGGGSEEVREVKTASGPAFIGRL